MISGNDIELYKQIRLGDKKPKLKNMFKLVGLTPNKFQESLIKYIDEEYSTWHTLVMNCARRSGKSTGAALIAVLDLVIPYSSVGLVAPSNKQLNIIFDEVYKLVKKLNLPIEKIDTNSKTLKLTNGSTFNSVSEKTVANLEGVLLTTLIIDEMFLLNNLKSILNSLSPALSTVGVHEKTKMPVGKIIMLGSTKSNLEAMEYLNKGLRKENGYVALKFTALDNPLLSKEFLNAELNKLGEETYNQEYMCIPKPSDISIVFGDFNYDKNVQDLSFIKSILDKDSTMLYGLDIGATDNTSFILCYVEAGKFYVIDGFEINNSSEKMIANRINDLLTKYNLKLSELSFIDPSAKLTRIGLATDYNLAFYPAKNDIRGSINVLNSLFRDEKLYIDINMNSLISQIQKIEWSSNRNSKDPFKKNKEHHFDFVAALRYAIFTYSKMYVNYKIEVI